MRPPIFITFTGADDATNIDQMRLLSTEYPVEWGILMHPEKLGQPRYPTIDWIRKLTDRRPRVKLAAHICGGYSQMLIGGGFTNIDGIIARFHRVQVNLRQGKADPAAIDQWATDLGVAPILQTRDEIPENREMLRYLVDASGGTGKTRETWPKAKPYVMSGFAGGFTPDNIKEQMTNINAAQDIDESFLYWLDMETGVRTENKFDIDKCRAVCEAVYGMHYTAVSRKV